MSTARFIVSALHERSPAPRGRGRFSPTAILTLTVPSSLGVEVCWTHRWRGMDSNFRFRAFLSLRSSPVFSIPRSRSAEGTDAESGTEAISLKRKESGGLPIAVGCRSKTGRVPCLPICWAEQCEPDILLYRSPYKCFPQEKTGCNPS